MKYIFCHRNDYSLCFVTRNIFPVRQINNFFPVTQGVFLVTGFVPILAINIHPMSLCMCSNSIFPVTRTFFSCDLEYFSYEVWVVFQVDHIFATKAQDEQIQISCETLRFRGNLVPRFPRINPPCMQIISSSPDKQMNDLNQIKLIKQMNQMNYIDQIIILNPS